VAGFGCLWASRWRFTNFQAAKDRSELVEKMRVKHNATIHSGSRIGKFPDKAALTRLDILVWGEKSEGLNQDVVPATREKKARILGSDVEQGELWRKCVVSGLNWTEYNGSGGQRAGSTGVADVPPFFSSRMTSFTAVAFVLLSNPGFTFNSRSSIRMAGSSFWASVVEHSFEKRRVDSRSESVRLCSLEILVSSSCGVLGGRNTWLIKYFSDSESASAGLASESASSAAIWGS
jgi:hypothetical protein